MYRFTFVDTELDAAGAPTGRVFIIPIRRFPPKGAPHKCRSFTARANQLNRARQY